MARHALINEQGLVVGCIVWDGAEWLPPKNHYVVFSPICDVGDTYDFEKEEFFRPDLTAKDE